MNCKQAEELLPLYAGRDLEEKRATSVTEHLQTCAACAHVADEYRESVQLTEQFAPPVFSEAVYAGIRQRVLREIETEAMAPAWSQTIASLFRPRLTWARWAIASVLLIVVSMVAIYFIMNRGHDEQQLANKPPASVQPGTKERSNSGPPDNARADLPPSVNTGGKKQQLAGVPQPQRKRSRDNNVSAQPGSLPEPMSFPQHDSAAVVKTMRVEISRIFEVKYRDPNSLLNAVYQLGSGFKGSAMSANAEFKTITVRDFPENIATIEEALKRLDVPGAARPNIELHMHVLVASNAGGPATDVPAELKDVLTELRGTLNYRNYELAASIVQRLTETPRGLQGSGIAELPSTSPGTPNSSMPYEYAIHNVSLVQNATGPASVQIAEFTFVTLEKERARVQTSLNLRDGEKVVVGTATLRNRALVIVLTAKLIK